MAPFELKKARNRRGVLDKVESGEYEPIESLSELLRKLLSADDLRLLVSRLLSDQTD